MTLSIPATQAQLQLIHREAQGITIDQRHSDGYINLTAMCKAAGKQVADYLRLDRTKAFLLALSLKTGFPIDKGNQRLIEVKPGSPTTGGGTWGHPKVAIDAAVWASADFAVLVTDWVEDYWRIKNSKPTALPAWFSRAMLNKGRIPSGYFSILDMTATEIIGPLHQRGVELPDGWDMDISVAKRYCSHLRSNLDIEPSDFSQYLHEWLPGDPRKPCYAYLYPNKLLEDFYSWLATEYMPKHAKTYFKGKDPAMVPKLDQHPLLAPPTKTHPANLPWRNRAA